MAETILLLIGAPWLLLVSFWLSTKSQDIKKKSKELLEELVDYDVFDLTFIILIVFAIFKWIMAIH